MFAVPAHTTGATSRSALSARCVMPRTGVIASARRCWNNAIDARLTSSCGQYCPAMQPSVIVRLRTHSMLLHAGSVPATSPKPPQLAATTIVNVCAASGAVPFEAVNVIAELPAAPADGVPDSVRVVVLKLIPGGSVPLRDNDGVGTPVTPTTNEHGDPATHATAFALVIRGATNGLAGGVLWGLSGSVPAKYSARFDAPSPSLSTFGSAPVAEPKYVSSHQSGSRSAFASTGSRR